MDHGAETEAVKRRRFLWGVPLAWVPFLYFVAIPLSTAIREISAQKATGLGAVAGGLSEAFVPFGFVTAVVIEVVALVLLFRAFSRGHSVRAVFTVVHLLLCADALRVWFYRIVVPFPPAAPVTANRLCGVKS